MKIPRPSIKGRKEIIKYYLNKIKSDVDVDKLASETINFTGSDIKTMCNIAILNAVKNKRKLAIW